MTHLKNRFQNGNLHCRGILDISIQISFSSLTASFYPGIFLRTSWCAGSVDQGVINSLHRHLFPLDPCGPPLVPSRPQMLLS